MINQFMQPYCSFSESALTRSFYFKWHPCNHSSINGILLN